MSTWETMEENEPIPENVKDDLEELTNRVLDLSMSYRRPDFKLESIRH